MNKNELKIGLALSGGGMRAAVYHLGVLKYLAEQHLLGSVAHISTVSGASICMGLIYGCNDNTWPDDETFLKNVLPKVKKYITEKDIQWTALFRLIVSPYYWDKKVNLLGNVMEKRWHIQGCLHSIASHPLWTINTTCFETGKDFRISSVKMGQTDGAHVKNPHIRISHAMAASAGFPVLIGPYKLKTKDYTWCDKTGTITIKPRDEILHLWDGGVYDNMGLDPLFRMRGEDSLIRPVNYLIVSNASTGISHKTRTMSFSISNLKRLLDINMNQVNTLRSTSIKDMFREQHNGVYLDIGTRVVDIVKRSKLSNEESKRIVQSALSDEQVNFVKDYKTSLERVPVKDFDCILKHGYETAACTFHCLGHFA